MVHKVTIPVLILPDILPGGVVDLGLANPLVDWAKTNGVGITITSFTNNALEFYNFTFDNDEALTAFKLRFDKEYYIAYEKINYSDN